MIDPAAKEPNGWAVLRRNRAAVVSLWFIVALTSAAIVLPVLLPEQLKRPSDATFLAPLTVSPEHGRLHLFGTDINGQDLFYRVLTGARVSLGIGLAGALVSLLVGTTLGLLAGYLGGRVEAVIMRAIDVLQSVPRILFIMVLIAALDSRFKSWLDSARLAAQERDWDALAQWLDGLLPYSRILILIVALGLIEWMTMARIIRAQVLVLREQGFVQAARCLGERPFTIMRRHLLPNLATIILTYLTLTVPAVILDESFLSFLGLGIEAPAASWGSLLKDGAQIINPLDQKWWLLAFPALFMSATLLALNFLGDGLRDAFDPRSRGH